jgi:hypothetical protein
MWIGGKSALNRKVAMFIRSQSWVSFVVFLALLFVAADSAVGGRPKKRKKPNAAPPSAATSDPEETKDKPAIESSQLPVCALSRQDRQHAE